MMILQNDDPRLQFLFGFLLWLLLLITLGVYWAGLPGEFILDDIPNLDLLGGNPNYSVFERARYFILMGNSGPLGRPLSLITFFINDIAWPSDPFSFKYTNVLIHLLNGALIFWLSFRLLEIHRESTHQQQLFISFIASAFWLLHPLNVSTVLYVIQRMTELSTLFVLSGLLAYLRGRQLITTRLIAAYTWLTISVIFAALGIFCKETAALFPAFVLVIECALLQGKIRLNNKRWDYWAFVFLLLPVFLIIGWHFLKYPGMQFGYITRPFTMTERLLTESRVLFEYLGYIIFPRRVGTGLFHDDFAVSSGLVDPISTLLSVILIAAAMFLAIKFRKRFSLFSFGVLWFIVGHSLEAGPIPLEIYFEHRNYLPMFGPILAICYGAFQLKGQLKYVGVVGITFLVIIGGIATYQNTTIWNNTVLLSEVWALEHPNSSRAQQFSADMWARRGRFDIAQNRIQQLVKRVPNTTSAYVALVQLNCLQKLDFKNMNSSEIFNGLSRGKWDSAAPSTIQLIFDLLEKKHCPGLTLKDIDHMIITLTENARFRHKRKTMARLYFLRAKLLKSVGDFDETIKALNLALKYDANTDIAMYQAHIFSSAGNYRDALDSLAKARKLDRHSYFNLPIRRKELNSWEIFLKKQLGAQSVD